MEQQPENAPEAPKAEDYISYDYFSKLKIRIAEVKAAERVEGADKLLETPGEPGRRRPADRRRNRPGLPSRRAWWAGRSCC